MRKDLKMNDVGTKLLESIKSKDVQESVSQVQQFIANIKDATVANDYVMWISEPVNLTRVHQALAEDLSVPPRLLAIRRVLMSRTRRAILLMNAMEAAIKKVHNL